MGWFRRRKSTGSSLSGAGGSGAVVRHQDTGLVVMTADDVFDLRDRGTVAGGVVQVAVAVGQQLVLERSGGSSSMRVEKIEVSGQLLDQVAAGTKAGIYLKPAPTVLGAVEDALT